MQNSLHDGSFMEVAVCCSKSAKVFNLCGWTFSTIVVTPWGSTRDGRHLSWEHFCRMRYFLSLPSDSNCFVWIAAIETVEWIFMAIFFYQYREIEIENSWGMKWEEYVKNVWFYISTGNMFMHFYKQFIRKCFIFIKCIYLIN